MYLEGRRGVYWACDSHTTQEGTGGVILLKILWSPVNCYQEIHCRYCRLQNADDQRQTGLKPGIAMRCRCFRKVEEGHCSYRCWYKYQLWHTSESRTPDPRMNGINKCRISDLKMACIP